MCLKHKTLNCCIGVIQWNLIQISFISCEIAHDDTAKAYFTIFVAATILITAKDILCLLGVLIKIVLMCYWFHNQECSPDYGLSILHCCIGEVLFHTIQSNASHI